jgi:hypothetical protein
MALKLGHGPLSKHQENDEERGVFTPMRCRVFADLSSLFSALRR